MPNPIQPLDTAVATVIATLITTLFTTGLVVTVMANTISVQQKKAPVSGYRVVKVYPHDRQAFTQGLQYVDGVLYEAMKPPMKLKNATACFTRARDRTASRGSGRSSSRRAR